MAQLSFKHGGRVLPLSLPFELALINRIAREKTQDLLLGLFHREGLEKDLRLLYQSVQFLRIPPLLIHRYQGSLERFLVPCSSEEFHRSQRTQGRNNRLFNLPGQIEILVVMKIFVQDHLNPLGNALARET